MTIHLHLQNPYDMTPKRVYTKRGDSGQTSLANGERVPKDDIRVETNGQLDELNALLGLVVVHYPAADKDREELRLVQRRVTQIMACVAEADMAGAAFCLTEDTQRLESLIDEAMGDHDFHFLLPGESLLDALLHLARAKARTCERRLLALSRHHPLREDIIAYVNRVSDYLYALAVKSASQAR